MTQRYDQVTNIIDLILKLHDSTAGLCLDEIASRFDVHRRTAERMLRAVREVIPELESETRDDGRKYWRVPATARLRGLALARLRAEELAALDTAVELLARDGRPDQHAALQSLADKARALAPIDSAARIATDAEALLEGEGLATRPGPRPAMDLAIVATLRDALLRCHEVRMDYTNRGSGTRALRDIRPLGFILGGRHYLVAIDVATGEMRMFALSNIHSVEILGASFERPQDLDLRAYAERAFGVYQQKPEMVVWRFKPEAAALAREYRFHPTQRTEEQEDGSLIVRFSAGGLWEMAWHLFQWGDGVEIIEPAGLRDELIRRLEQALENHRDA